MATRTTKTTAQPAEAPQTPAAAPVSPARSYDLAALAAGAQTAPTLPTTGDGASSPFIPLLERSREEGVAFALPPVPDAKAAKSVMLAVRRAAALLNCGVRVRTTPNDDGAVTVSFQHKVKRGAK